MKGATMLRTERTNTALSNAPPTQGFRHTQTELAHFNRRRLEPVFDAVDWRETQADEQVFAGLEGDFVDQIRADIAPLLQHIPSNADEFVAWFEDLRTSGPGQGDPLFPWLAEHASYEQMRWFLLQEVAGEAGFDDLVALTQVKMPERAKLEMARNYWDEMGRGGAKGMHGPMLGRLAEAFAINPIPETTVPEALALGNLMIALAYNRRYAFHSVGALGAIEMTAPTRVSFVNAGLKRLGVPARERHYFALHATLDIRHSQDWNREVLASLVAEDGRRARPIAEGALMRLLCGQRCFERYRAHFKLPSAPAASEPRKVQ
jgi:hypothetical protein